MEKLYQEKESKPCLRIVLEKDKTQYEALNQKCFSNHPSFWISAEVLNWNPSDDKSFILGFFNETELISYIKVNLFHSKSDLLTRLLGFPEQAVPQDIQFPAMYIARAATSPDYMRKGYYTKLRRILLELGYSFQIRYVCNTLIEEEPRVDSLVRAGFIFFRNPVKWNTAKYRSSNFALVGFLDMFKNKEKFLFSDDPEAMHFIKSQKSQFKDWLYNYLRPSTTGATELQFHYTKNNHYKFGFSKKFFFLRQSLQDQFFIDFGRSMRQPLDFRAECQIAASEISATFPKKDIYLCFSGGIDSEIMCEAFRFARIPFKIIIARYSQNKNEHDFQWAIKYCQRHSLQYQFFDIDIFEFFKSQEFVQITSTTGCSYPMLTATMKLMSHVARDLNGIPVLGSGECQILRQNERWLMVEPEPIQSLYRYLITNRLPGVPGFFQWSPELMLAFLVDPLLVKMTKNELQGVESSMDIKAQIYKNYFSFELRPKYRGYEMFQDVMQEMLKRSMSIVGWPLVNWKIEYSELKTRLTPKIQKY